MSFLSDVFKEGKAYSTVNVHRSMLSVTLDPIEGHPIGCHPLVIRLLKGIYNSKPPAAKYKETWDVNSVLIYLRDLPDSSLPILLLSHKLSTLLALSTLFRTSELASIDLKSIRFQPNSVSFSLLRPRKAQKSGPLQSVCLNGFSDPSIDPVRCLKRYIDLTAEWRNSDNDAHLFIGSVRPHRPVTPSTVSGWIKSQLKAAGVDVEKFSAHSTRGAGASKAINSGVPMSAVLNAGHWAAESTFTRFYRRDVVPVESVF